MQKNLNSRNYKKKKIPELDHEKYLKMMTIKNVAEKYGFSEHTVYNWVSRDGLKHIRNGQGSKILIKQADVEAFIDAWYGDEPRMMWMAHGCIWLGCEEFSEIDLTIQAKPDYLPDGWEHLVISKGWLADKVMPAAHVSGWLCPKHYAELLNLLKKDEVEEPDKDTAPGKGLENEERHDINVNADRA
jgi:excisionase family DNA binding protein